MADVTTRSSHDTGAIGIAAPGAATPNDSLAASLADSRLWRIGLAVLGIGLVVQLAYAFMPHSVFIHRGDDAYYYFKLAANYPVHGFWTFDGIHRTNGVQPLWAIILSAVAQLMSWLSIRDAETLVRVFAFLTVLLNWASAALLAYVLAKRVSPGTGIVVAGAFLFPLGTSWAHAWGMENSLYAFLLVSVVAYLELRFRRSPRPGSAVVLGVLLGLTALSRLNAGMLIPCALLYFLLWRRSQVPFGERLRLAIIAGAAASAVVIPYLAWNYATTSHFLPVSGAVKAWENDRMLTGLGIENPLSKPFASYLFWYHRYTVFRFLTWHIADGLWALGARVVYGDAIPIKVAFLMLGALLVAPFALGRPREWLRRLGERFARLGPFTYVAVFGALNAVISVALYPSELGYAMSRWWFADNELVLAVIAATIAVAAVGYIGERLVRPSLRVSMAGAALVLLAVWHGAQMYRMYWGGEFGSREWNRSWNEESYLAAQWLGQNLPPDVRVGSWNAGVLGYYSRNPVVNLDGLMNDFEFLKVRKEQRVADYIKREKIQYLSDMGSRIDVEKLVPALTLTEVYRHDNAMMREAYRIYRVEP